MKKTPKDCPIDWEGTYLKITFWLFVQSLAPHVTSLGVNHFDEKFNTARKDEKFNVGRLESLDY